MEMPEEDPAEPRPRRLRGWFARRRGKNKPAAAPAKSAAE
jgi:hypothetical protein